MPETNISERAIHALPGTHERVVEIARRHAPAGSRALDLGAGSGALMEKLLAAGFKVTGADISHEFSLDADFARIDLNDPSFERLLTSEFSVITSVEVIEHLENPTAFLRSIRKLLTPDGVAILTTPNVDNVAGRIRFLTSGRVRIMEEQSPLHITPIHLDLFVRQLLPRAEMKLLEHYVHPEGDFPLTSRRYFVPFFRALAPLLGGPAKTGDCHIFVLKRLA